MAARPQHLGLGGGPARAALELEWPNRAEPAPAAGLASRLAEGRCPGRQRAQRFQFLVRHGRVLAAALLPRTARLQRRAPPGGGGPAQHPLHPGHGPPIPDLGPSFQIHHGTVLENPGPAEPLRAGERADPVLRHQQRQGLRRGRGHEAQRGIHPGGGELGLPLGDADRRRPGGATTTTITTTPPGNARTGRIPRTAPRWTACWWMRATYLAPRTSG